MTDLKSGLQVQHWWHALTLFGAAAVIADVAAPINDLYKWPVFLLALGLFFLGIGEWINHPLQERIGVGFKISGYPRKNSASGLLLDVTGIAIAAVGLYRLVQRG